VVLQEEITIKGKLLHEHFEAKNHEHAINYLYTLVKPDYVLSSKDILSLYKFVTVK